jgi:hypothetical protein
MCDDFLIKKKTEWLFRLPIYIVILKGNDRTLVNLREKKNGRPVG